jgi:hypothetical protein
MRHEMIEERMGPWVMRLESVVRDVVDDGDGGLAVLTANGIDLLDRALRRVGALAGEASHGDRLRITDDGRFLVFPTSSCAAARPPCGGRGAPPPVCSRLSWSVLTLSPGRGIARHGSSMPQAARSMPGSSRARPERSSGSREASSCASKAPRTCCGGETLVRLRCG